ncbi:MAG: [citrate (pro-3S)-lyase] ligase [Synergistaceae bacterium]|jgi:[citrate (pro-3S)-lyase] ligase|nr:[citrate (pro-3S)-lyase] ligase [Synergistaceae bacterium]
MHEYPTVRIIRDGKRENEQLSELLAREGVRRDRNVDYTIGMYDGDDNLIATGSCSANTIRCVAVDGARQGGGLLGTIISRLLERMADNGVTHAFLYTRQDKARYFGDMGFHEIASGLNLVTFMENRRDGFPSFVRELSAYKRDGEASALVMNCNPFTLGHRYLIERASSENRFVHIFVVSEDASFFPFADRYELVERGVFSLQNVTLHQTRSYMISSAVFPSYFLKDDDEAVAAQAHLDLNIFKKIASAMGISRRYVGTEPSSRVTGLYNSIMREELPKSGIECVEAERAKLDGQPISASLVRQAIHDGDMDAVRSMVPQSTYDYLETERGREIVKRLRESISVVHH